MPPDTPPDRAEAASPRRRAALRGAAVLACVALAAACLFALPDVGWVVAQRETLLGWHAESPWLSCLGFTLLFTLMAACAMPGTGVLALAAGMLFGGLLGTLLVALASTFGATLSFLAARHLWRDAVQRRWGHRLAGVEAGLARDGALYLYSLRMLPIVPFSVLNALMGLSAMPIGRFFSVSLIGMLAGSAAYAYAGTALAGAATWRDLLQPSLVLGLCALAALPWGLRAAWRRARAALASGSAR